jgi:DNA-binding transcriptional MerR regulator
MKTYKTAEVASIIGIHPNTVRLYEKLGLIPRVKRQENGYRIFTEKHVEQMKLARLAFKVELIQNGLRKKWFRW